MSTQTLHQGSLRPTRIPAITVVHPGLQVHSIAAPKIDRRLSFLMSANLYCAFAAGAVLVAHTAPAFHKPDIRTEREVAVVDLVPPAAAPRSVAVVAPPRLLNNLQPQTFVAPTLTGPQPIENTDLTPTRIGTADLSNQIASNSPSTTGPYNNAPNTNSNGRDLNGPPTGPPIEVSASAVSILHQVQPIYPGLARLAHKEGDVVLIMTINEQGVPTEVKMDSGDAVFRNDAIRAAQQWRFTSARIDGQPHTARFRLTLQFRLRG